MTYADLLREIERLRFRVQMLEGQLGLRRRDVRTNRCAYCGAACRGKVCSAHTDVALADALGPDRRVAA